MREQGVITRVISPQLVEVAFQRSAACEKCGLCPEVGEGMVAIEAFSRGIAKKDDIVEIEIPSAEVVKGSLVVFLLPVLFLIIGYLIGAALVRGVGLPAWQEAAGIIFALISAAASYFVVRWYDRNVQQREALRATIVKVTKSG